MMSGEKPYVTLENALPKLYPDQAEAIKTAIAQDPEARVLCREDGYQIVRKIPHNVSPTAEVVMWESPERKVTK